MMPKSNWLTVHPVECVECNYNNSLRCLFACEYYTAKALEPFSEALEATYRRLNATDDKQPTEGRKDENGRD